MLALAALGTEYGDALFARLPDLWQLASADALAFASQPSALAPAPADATRVIFFATSLPLP
jgi:hypothetical protein